MRLKDAFRNPQLVQLNDTGTDQVAMHRQWWDFEAPLPVVVACLAEGLQDKAFYDVGANTGFYSVLVGGLQPQVTLRSFEPVDLIASQCRENLAKHGLAAAVQEVALSDAHGTSTLYFPPDDHGLIETSASLNAHFNPVNMREMDVPTVRLDDVVSAQGDTVGLLKIDVEGHEHAVLDGGRGTFSSQRPLAVIEVLPGGDLMALNRFVADMDYCAVALRSSFQVERRNQLEFVSDGHNWLLAPAERTTELLTMLVRGLADFLIAQRRCRWRSRLTFGAL